MTVETEERRIKRERQRVLFDTVARLYDSSRRGYPKEIVELVVTTANVGAGAPVLEIGCGTGQLTQQLAPYGFELFAIDIGPSMVEEARRRVSPRSVTFEAVPFEEFDAAGRSFDLIVSATAFHWVDPDIGYTKAARLLRSGGWLALLSTGEKYDDPLGSALTEMWIARSDDGGRWLAEKPPTDVERIEATGLFHAAVTRTHTERATLPADVVVDLEQTRATVLSFDDGVRERFVDELREHLRSLPLVPLDQVTAVTMAQRI